MTSTIMNVVLTIGMIYFLCIAAYQFIKPYSSEERKTAAWKAFFLWIVSTSPVLASIALSRPDPKIDQIWSQLFEEILSRLALNELFVYSAAFLAPMIYVIFDVRRAYKTNEINLTYKDVSNYLRGMEKVFLTAFCILGFTMIAYAGSTANNNLFQGTYLHLLFQEKGFIIYFSSLLIWYTVILREVKEAGLSLEESIKEETDNFSEKLAERRRTKK